MTLSIQPAASLDPPQRRGVSKVLAVDDLSVEYVTESGTARAVDRVSFTIAAGEVFGLAGESGCGKTTIVHAIMRLIKPPGEITGGAIRFEGRDVLAMSAGQLRKFRWRDASLVSQSAMNALNPVISLGAQLRDAIQAHEKMSRSRTKERAAELFELVGLDSRRLDSYAHELSGGMRQRAVIAMALALNPGLVIMDEPTTALDVVVQRDILQQIQELQARFGFSILFITHDLSLLIEFADRVGIMYAGRLVEMAPSAELLENPLHPYTVGLMNSFPSLDGEKQILQGIPGSPPDLAALPAGCRFSPRCSRCVPDGSALYRRQTGIQPELRELSPGHWVSCHLYQSNG